APPATGAEGAEIHAGQDLGAPDLSREPVARRRPVRPSAARAAAAPHARDRSRGHLALGRESRGVLPDDGARVPPSRKARPRDRVRGPAGGCDRRARAVGPWVKGPASPSAGTTRAPAGGGDRPRRRIVRGL